MFCNITRWQNTLVYLVHWKKKFFFFLKQRYFPLVQKKSEINNLTNNTTTPSPFPGSLLRTSSAQSLLFHAPSLWTFISLNLPHFLSHLPALMHAILMVRGTFFSHLCLNNSFLIFMSYSQCHFLQEAFHTGLGAWGAWGLVSVNSILFPQQVWNDLRAKLRNQQMEIKNWENQPLSADKWAGWDFMKN